MAHASFTSDDDQLRDKCFLSHLAELLSTVNEDGNKVFIDTMSLMEFTCLKLHSDQRAGGPYSECHFVGSVGEGISGLDIFSNNSDIDIMFVMKSVQVVERRPIKTNKKCEQLLKMIDVDTTPGYVKLKILENETYENNAMKEDEFLLNSIVQNAFKAYGNASNAGLLSRMVELLGDKMTINWFVNGPSCSTNLETGNRNILTNRLVWIESVDCVIGLKCNEWPEIADEWIERSREYNWPPGDLIEKAVSLGCYMVPIGGRQSITEDLEWRISFVLAERLLVRNMKYMQLFVYSLLKSVRKEIFRDYSVIISSYIIKTVVFWVMEENDAPSWKPEHVVHYVRICFQKLLEFLEDDFCPNYFMRKCNLFHLKYSEDEKNTLIRLVKEFVTSPTFSRSLCSLKAIENVRRNVYGLCRIPAILSTYMNYVKDIRDTLVFRYVSEDVINRFADSMVNRSEESDANIAIKSITLVLKAMKKNEENFSHLLKETLIGHFSCMQIRSVCAATYHNKLASSEPFTLQQRFDVVHYLIENSNLQVENLTFGEVAQLAHAFFSFGCIRNCLHILTPALDNMIKTPQIRIENYMSIFEITASFLFTSDGNMALTSPYRPMVLIQLYPFEFPVLTKDIQTEMLALKIQQDFYSEVLKPEFTFKVTVDPVIYACYLKFKCLRILGDNIGSCVAINLFGDFALRKVSHRYIALSLLGCCLKENGYTRDAVKMFGRSFRAKKGRLSTLYHVAIMLNREFAKSVSSEYLEIKTHGNKMS